MKITHKEYPLAVVADSLDPPQIRKDGYHVTNLIAEGLAISQCKRATPFTGDDSGLMAMGRIWEPSARPWLSEYAGYLGYTVEYPTQDKPLETWIGGDILGNMDAKVWEGVCAVCDGLGFEPGYRPILDIPCDKCHSTGKRLVAIVDMKFTTGNPDFTQKHQNMHQFKAYCYAEGVKEFWILILYVSHKGKPEARFYVDVLEFEQEELDATWKLIVDTREYLEKVGCPSG